MKAHDLAALLLKCENLEVTTSIDISTNEKDNHKRLYGNNCRGINSLNGDAGVITILFDLESTN